MQINKILFEAESGILWQIDEIIITMTNKNANMLVKWSGAHREGEPTYDSLWNPKVYDWGILIRTSSNY